MMTESENLRYIAHEKYNCGQYWPAISECLKAITVSPASQWPYLLLGKCYAKCSRPRDSVAMLERFLSLDPDPYSDSMTQAKALLEEVKAKTEESLK